MRKRGEKVVKSSYARSAGRVLIISLLALMATDGRILWMYARMARKFDLSLL